MAPRSSNTAGSVASGTSPFPSNGGPGGHSVGGAQAAPSPRPGTKPYNNGLTPSLATVPGTIGNDYGSVVFGGYPGTSDIDDPPPWQPTTNPNGGSSGRGGGGGAAPIDYQPWFDQWSGYKPAQYTYTPREYQDFEFADYEGTGFYDWDPTMYDTAKAGIKTGIAGATQAAGNALDRSYNAYGNMGNGFRNANVVRQGGLDPRIQQSMADYGDDGAGGELTSQNAGLNRGMDGYLNMLAGGSDDYRQHMMASVQGDRASMLDRMGMAEVTLTMGVEMAMVKAKAQYDKDKWQYGEEIARQNYQKNLAIAQANHAGHTQADIDNNRGFNDANNANTLAQNTHESGLRDATLDILGSGGKVDTSGYDPYSGRWTAADQAYKEGKDSGAIDQATIDRLLAIPDWQKRQDAKIAAVAATRK